MIRDDSVARPTLVVIRFACELFDFANHRHKERRIKVAALPLFERRNTLQAHACVNGRFGQRGERPIAGALILHENKIPNL